MVKFTEKGFRRWVFSKGLSDIFEAAVFPEHLRMTASYTHTKNVYY